MTIAFLNGDFLPLSEAKISPMDRGFLFGDGIYEVIPTYQAKPVGMKGHMARLKSGLSAISIANPYDETQWRDILATLVEKNSPYIPSGNIGIYFHVSRGTDSKRFHAFPDNIAPTVFGFAFEICLQSSEPIDPPAPVIQIFD